MIEEWKDVKGYEGLYQVSNCGNVKRLERTDTRCRQGFRIFKERPLKPFLSHGYWKVVLTRDSISHQKFVHRLVAEAFVPNKDDHKNQVNHIDGNKTNNFVSNLEWCTNQENMIHAFKNGLVPKRGKRINGCPRLTEEEKQMILNHEMCDRELAKLLGRTIKAIQSARARLKRGINDENT